MKARVFPPPNVCFILLMIVLTLPGCGRGISQHVTKPVPGSQNLSIDEITQMAGQSLQMMGYGIQEQNIPAGYVYARKRVVEDIYGRSTEIKINVQQGQVGEKVLGVEAFSCRGCIPEAHFSPSWMANQFYSFFDLVYKASGRSAGTKASPVQGSPPPGSISGSPPMTGKSAEGPLSAPSPNIVPTPGAERTIERRTVYLGVKLVSVTPELAAFLGLSEPKGAAVQDNLPDSPAAKAGLKKGDVLLEVDRQPVRDPRDVIIAVSKKSPGDSMTLSIWRAGAVSEKTVTLAAIPRGAESPPAQDAAGSAAVQGDPAPGGVGNPPLEKVRPSIRITRMEIAPGKVKPESKFDLKVQYAASDPSAERKTLTVRLTYAIYRQETLLFESAPIDVESINGGGTERKESINAAKNAGVYTMKVRLQYNDAVANDEHAFTIE